MLPVEEEIPLARHLAHPVLGGGSEGGGLIHDLCFGIPVARPARGGVDDPGRRIESPGRLQNAERTQDIGTRV